MKKCISMLVCFLLILSLAAPARAEDALPNEGEGTIQPQNNQEEGGGDQGGSDQGSQDQGGGEDTPPHSHSFDTLVSDTATCGAAGTATYSCSCGEQTTRDSEATGRHSYGNAVMVNETTHEQVCSVCSDKVTANHAMNSGTVTKEANCKETGTRVFACTSTGCSYTKTETIPVSTTHSYGDWATTSADHTRTCSVCGNKDSGLHSMKEEITKKPTCKEAGTKKVYCTVCGYGSAETVAIPVLTTHTYDSACDPECNVCEKEREIEHTFTTLWQKDGKTHWYECTKCGEKKDEAKHIPGPAATEQKEQLCLTCGYVMMPKKNHVHNYGTAWTSDEVGHWHACTGCEEEKEYGSHTYDNACDSDCNTCGYKRADSHNYDTDGWMTSSFEHWNICTICGEESKHEKHVAGPEATEDAAQVCTVCNYELAPRQEHTHDFGIHYLADNDIHWQECECGERSVPEPHVWDQGRENKDDTITYRCTVCGGELVEQAPSSGFPWLILILVLLALVCIGGIIAIVVILKRGDFDDDSEEDSEDDFEDTPEEDAEEAMITDFFRSRQNDIYK